MAAGCPALCKRGQSSSVSFRPFSAPSPRLLNVLLVPIFLTLLPVGWSSDIVIRSTGELGDGSSSSGSPQLLAYRPQGAEHLEGTGNGAFIFCEFLAYKHGKIWLLGS